MNKLYLSLIFLISLCCFTYAQDEKFNMRQLACELSQPWEITMGPDGYIWVTEAHSYQIRRVDPISGVALLMLDLSGKKNFPDFNEADEWPQGGLQGMAFHNRFETNPYVYIAYVYDFDSCGTGINGCFFKTKIVRYTYNMNTFTFTDETVVADSLPGSTDHNGGRLAIGPDSANNNFLFYSIGDMGSGHLGNGARQHHGQDINVYEGKILRFNLTPDGDVSESDSWIPNDNPFNRPFKQSAVWTLGHRNPQGLVFGTNGLLYDSEHGPYSDDEINLIIRGHNYGYPLIMGFADGNYDGSAHGAGPAAPHVISEVTNREFIEQTYPYSEPLASFFAVSRDSVHTMYTNDVNDTPPFPNYYLQYPTTAPSGIDFYSSDGIPGWKNSLLMANLKLANVYRLKLSASGKSITHDTIVYFQGLGRFRDIAISEDGKKIYVSTDSVGRIKGAPGESVVPPNRGCILEFSYVPVGTNDLNLSERILIYPNPASKNVTVQLPPEISNADVYISTITGEKNIIGNNVSDKTDFNLSNLHSGLYFMEIVVANNVWNKKLLIK
jgi:PQQ-dependent dehydrogenase (s-GDH family)